MVDKITVSKEKANALEEAKVFGGGFVGCVCDDCKAKCTKWLGKHIYLLPFPNIYGKKLQGLLCKQCKTNISNKLRGK